VVAVQKSRSGPSARAKILQAAEALFCATGFEGTSVATIASKAGVTKAAVFYHFGSKEKLFEGVLDGYYARQRALFFEAAESAGDPRARMHRVVDVYHRSLVENRRYLMLVISVLSSDSPHTENIRKSVTPLVEWLEQELESVISRDGPRSTLHIYISLAGAINHYFSHMKVLEESYGDSMMTPDALAERAEHLHWLVDTLFERLAADAH